MMEMSARIDPESALRETEFWLAKLLVAGLKPDPFTYELLLIAASRSGDSDAASKYLHVAAKDAKVSSRMIRFFSKACARGGEALSLN